MAMARNHGPTHTDESGGERWEAVTVTLNPAVDLFITVDALRPGALHRVKTPVRYPGGKGINVSKMLRELGLPTRTTGFVGGANGRWLVAQLEEAGIPTEFIPIQNETRLNVKVIESGGQLTELNSAAPSIVPDEWTALERAVNQLAQPNRWLAFCGNLPEGCRADWYATAIAEAKRRGARTLLDASGAGLRMGVAAGPDVVKPNRAELADLIGRPLRTESEVVEAAAALVASGVGMVAVSMGADGLLAVTDRQAVRVTVPQVPVKSVVGAGDTVAAALLYAVCQGWPVEQAVRFAAAAGTAKVQQPGNVNPCRAAIDACLRETHSQSLDVFARLTVPDWRAQSTDTGE